MQFLTIFKGQYGKIVGEFFGVCGARFFQKPTEKFKFEIFPPKIFLDFLPDNPFNLFVSHGWEK
jgi:hypothetical protein